MQSYKEGYKCPQKQLIILIMIITILKSFYQWLTF